MTTEEVTSMKCGSYAESVNGAFDEVMKISRLRLTKQDQEKREESIPTCTQHSRKEF